MQNDAYDTIDELKAKLKVYTEEANLTLGSHGRPLVTVTEIMPSRQMVWLEALKAYLDTYTTYHMGGAIDGANEALHAFDKRFPEEG